ncbi:MAG TPA: adenosylcobinamide-GDP ribazoletransferase, partial [Candidatus Latescibacteria bacterium]|nr:adenosylcobinamide-GDP ribazoletransferase [Candidatus Latescibacterota bacterium]
MSASLWTTGAFHEDGFADTCDGFGGDWSKEDILRIMKDSRLGAYGVIGILLVLLLKYNALLSLPVKLVPPALIAGHATSRLLPVLAIASMRYVRQDQTSKARPVAGGISLWQVIIAAIFALLPMLLLDPPLW